MDVFISPRFSGPEFKPSLPAWMGSRQSTARALAMNCHFHFNFRRSEIDWDIYIYVNQQSSKELSGHCVNGYATLRNLSPVLPFLSWGSVWPFLPIMIGFDWEHLIKKKLCLVRGNESCLVPKITQGIMGRQFWLGQLRKMAQTGRRHWAYSAALFLRKAIPCRTALRQKRDEGVYIVVTSFITATT